jgi:energy-coupling factor transporter ATP-binding protein EcfA2
MTERDWEYITKDKNYSHWVKRKDRFYPANVTHNTLPSGVYEAKADTEDNVFFRLIEFPSDDLLSIPGMPTDYILTQIQNFWGKEESYKKFGLLFKRGILLYGPSGCGKTSIIRMLANSIIERKGIVVSVSDMDNVQSILLNLREIEPERPIMTIFEDIEGLMEKADDASDVLSFLDGEKQISNIIHLATTNKPDTLEDRLLKRPGRFDVVIGLNPPIKEARLAYLKHMIKDEVHDALIFRMVEDTDGMGMAHLRELVVSVLCLDQDYETTLKRLKGNIKNEIRMPKIGQKTVDGFTLGFTQEEK